MTDWINANARLAWVENQKPWAVEDEMLLHAT
ncbi:hypothetical protein [Glutamicibacter arilaitensis]